MENDRDSVYEYTSFAVDFSRVPDDWFLTFRIVPAKLEHVEGVTRRFCYWLVSDTSAEGTRDISEIVVESVGSDRVDVFYVERNNFQPFVEADKRYIFKDTEVASLDLELNVRASGTLLGVTIAPGGKKSGVRVKRAYSTVCVGLENVYSSPRSQLRVPHAFQILNFERSPGLVLSDYVCDKGISLHSLRSSVSNRNTSLIEFERRGLSSSDERETSTHEKSAWDFEIYILIGLLVVFVISVIITFVKFL